MVIIISHCAFKFLKLRMLRRYLDVESVFETAGIEQKLMLWYVNKCLLYHVKIPKICHNQVRYVLKLLWLWENLLPSVKESSTAYMFAAWECLPFFAKFVFTQIFLSYSVCQKIASGKLICMQKQKNSDWESLMRKNIHL